MQTSIKITYNAQKKRLMCSVPFHLNGPVRNFPSRRFEPKSKLWAVPLTRGNLDHLRELQTEYDVSLDDEARAAVAAFSEDLQGPVFQPFPLGYKFEESSTGFKPFNHQKYMLDRAWMQKAHAWFAKMGTGKTFATVHLACAYWLAGEIDAVVICCPATLRRTWEKELKKYATVPYDYFMHDRSRAYEDFIADKPTKALQVLSCSIEGFGVSEQLYDSVCGFFPGRRILFVVDESSRIKNHKAARTNRAIKLAASASYRLILNGTPIALGIQDLYSQYECLDPNIIGMGDYWAYRSRYIEMGGYEGKQIVGYKHVDELMARIRPYTTEVDKSVLDLPPKIPKQRYIDATPEQKALFRQILKGEGDAPFIKAENVLERTLRLRQVVGGWRPESVELPDGTWKTTLHPLDKNPKFADLKEFIGDHYEGSKFIIWSTFRHELEAIWQYLESEYGEGSAALYYGSTDQEARSRIEDAYCNNPSLRFFVGNPASAGLGLTLVSEFDDTMYYYSGTSAFIDRTQSEDRAHRIGQRNSVVIVDAIMNKTVDETIVAATERKQGIEEYVFEQIRLGKSEIEIFGG